MNAEFIRGLLRRQPFEPFRVIMSHGDSYVIKHPENAFLAGSRLIIYYPENDSLGYCSLLHINDVKMGEFAELGK
jgi:hypothetical protein